jgi:ABC-type Zn uptake system ZnuABC Zn-binding protein ZnuA
MTSRRLALFLLTLAAPAVMSGCTSAPPVWPEKGVRVVVSFAPLDSFAKKVVGTHGTVQCLCEGQNGVHDFEPSPNHAVLLHRADFLFINGLGLDDAFTEKLRINCGNPKLNYVKLGDLIPPGDLIKMKNSDETDPHVWLGVSRAVVMVKGIRDRLKEFDPANAKDYDENTENYIKELNDLLKEGQEKFAKLKDAKIISFHESLNYFAADFGVDVVGYIEPGPGVEPSAARYADIVRLCKEHHVHLIATEQQYSETAAKNIQGELKNRKAGEVTLVRVDPLEAATHEELSDPDFYVKTMRENIDNLVHGLQ